MDRHQQQVDLSTLRQQMCAGTSVYLTRGTTRDNVAVWPRKGPGKEQLARPLDAKQAPNPAPRL